MSPVVASVDIRAGDTATVALTMDKVTTLAGMKVTASSIRQQNIMDMEMRRERGEGDFLDSATAAKFPNTIAAINSLYAIPKKMCAIYVDGRKQFIPRGLLENGSVISQSTRYCSDRGTRLVGADRVQSGRTVPGAPDLDQTGAAVAETLFNYGCVRATPRHPR